MEEKTYTLNIRQIGTYQYEVTVTETGATKTAPTLDCALTLTLHDIVKHLTTRSLILVFADQDVDRDGQSADPQKCPETDLEHQVAPEVAQLDIAPQVKKRERHLVFVLSHHTRSHENKPHGSMSRRESSSTGITSKEELEVELDPLLEEEHDHRKAAAYE
jgi:hypothetical protein